jgi:hypothetical protein
MIRPVALTLLLTAASSTAVFAQPLSNRGFVEGTATLYPQDASNDPERAVGDLLVRDELFVRPASWLELSGGIDFRANSHDQVEDEWRFDWDDRSIQRPRLALRRATATVTHGPFTLDVGKQFIRWARTDVLNPEDRFAPKDYLSVVTNEVLPVLGVRPSLQLGKEIVEGVWVGQPTPSRLPLVSQRWAIIPAEAAALPIVDFGGALPERSQAGVRWRHVGDRLELAGSFFDGVNHIPEVVTSLTIGDEGPVAITLLRTYPRLRTYGADFALPTSIVTLKGEAAYFRSTEEVTDDYVLYVVELERQTGNWLVAGGYAGESVIEQRAPSFYNPERGLAKSIVAHAMYTGDPRRTVSVETAVRQNGDGVYVKGEYSYALTGHLRLTAAGVGIAGSDDDFIGQYHRNSSFTLGARFSF